MGFIEPPPTTPRALSRSETSRVKSHACAFGARPRCEPRDGVDTLTESGGRIHPLGVLPRYTLTVNHPAGVARVVRNRVRNPVVHQHGTGNCVDGVGAREHYTLTPV